MERSAVAIVIPAFNEEETITRVVQSVAGYGLPIVVDDCSTDNTANLARIAGAIVVSHKVNQGYDNALNSGFAEANKRDCLFVISFDGDGQHNTILIKQFLHYLQNKYDLVLGIRPGFARWVECLFACYTKMCFGVQDPLCGMKGYRMDLYRERGYFDSYQSIGTELTLYAVKHKKHFIQVPVPISERHGKSRLGGRWKADLKILRALILSFKHI